MFFLEITAWCAKGDK